MNKPVNRIAGAIGSVLQKACVLAIFATIEFEPNGITRECRKNENSTITSKCEILTL